MALLCHFSVFSTRPFLGLASTISLQLSAPCRFRLLLAVTLLQDASYAIAENASYLVPTAHQVCRLQPCPLVFVESTALATKCTVELAIHHAVPLFSDTSELLTRHKLCDEPKDKVSCCLALLRCTSRKTSRTSAMS